MARRLVPGGTLLGGAPGGRGGSAEAIGFWADRLKGAGYESERVDGKLRFQDYDGLEHELAVVDVPDKPLTANHPEVPAEMALQGFDNVRAYSSDPERSKALFEGALGFEPREDGWEARGEDRGGLYR